MRSTIEQLVAELDQLFTKGQRWLKIELLSKVLKKVLADSTDPEQQAELKALHYELTHQTRIEEWKEARETDRLLLHAVMEFAGGALKVITWMNGGAAVACLAFAANTKSGKLLDAMLFFTFGLVFGGLAHGGAYFAQYSYANKHEKKGDVYRAFTILFALMAYSLFVGGALSGYYNLGVNSLTSR